MNNPDTYAVSILLDRSGLLEVPLHVDFWPEPSQEVTYVRLASTENATLRNESFIASIPVHHPAGIVLDESNWAGFLYLMLRSKDKMQIEYKTDTRGCYKVSSEMSFGYYYFQVDSVNGLFGIIVDRPKETPRLSRSIKHAFTIKPSFGVFDRPHVTYDDEGIFLTKNRRTSHWIRFKERLSHKQILSIYIDGIDTLDLSAEMFRPAAGERELNFHVIEGFQYFKSLDGEVIFTLQKDPVKKIFQSLLESIRKLVDREEIKQSGELHREYQTLLNYNVLQNDTTEAKTDLLKRCIETLEKFHIAE